MATRTSGPAARGARRPAGQRATPPKKRTARTATARRPAPAEVRPPRRSLTQPLVVSGAVAVILGGLYLLAPLMGQDLSAQIAHADFARDHPLTPVDLRWFGGTLQFGYSLFVPYLAAHVGPQLLGVIAAVLATLLTTTIFVRTRVRRPVIGGVLAAVCQVANLTEGRIAFAVGLALALAALVPLTDRDGGGRLFSAFCALLAAAASPVAGLFLGVAALTLLVHRRIGDAVRLVVGAGLGVALVSVLFGDGGNFVYSGNDAARAAAVSLLVAVVAPRWASIVWTGAVIGVVMVAAAYAIDTPVGANASRLAMLFAIPVIAATAELIWWRATAAVAIAAVIQPPVVFGTIGSAGDPQTKPGYYAALLDRLRADGPLTGRVEIPELTGHWESAYVAREVPLARGWLRQVDIELWGDTFYGDVGPTSQQYATFLQQTSTQYVAVPSAPLAFYGRREADLIATGLPYLAEVWRNADWRLYAVSGHRPVVAAPATGVTLGAAAVTFTAPAKTEITIDVRWSRWLRLETLDPVACISPRGEGDDATVTVRTGDGGDFTLTSTLFADRKHCD